jgi:hypothetical protein
MWRRPTRRRADGGRGDATWVSIFQRRYYSVKKAYFSKLRCPTWLLLHAYAAMDDRIVWSVHGTILHGVLQPAGRAEGPPRKRHRRHKLHMGDLQVRAPSLSTNIKLFRYFKID